MRLAEAVTESQASLAIRSICRVTPVFGNIELSWVHKVVIWTPDSMATSLNFLPARSATASRLSVGDNRKNSANPSRKENIRPGR
jgi:hypothetical protein